jgi:hypothetical protein
MRDPAPVDVRDLAAVSSWLASVQGLVEELHNVAMDATLKAPHRRTARGHARGLLRRGFHRLHDRVDQVCRERIEAMDAAS